MAEGTLKKDDPLLVANREAVVLIKVTGTSLDGTTDPRRGTGFVINENGYILTAGHVVGNHFSWRNTSGDFSDLTGLQREVWVRRFNKQTKKLEKDGDKAIVLYQDDQRDLAILRVSSETPKKLKIGDSDTLGAGNALKGIGFGTKGDIHNLYHGKVNSAFDPEHLGFFRVDFNFDEGDSGGPIFNEEGAVVGIIIGGKHGSTKVGFGIPINVATDFINMALRATAVEEVIDRFEQYENNPDTPLPPSVKARFEQLEKKIIELKTVQEFFKEGAQVIPEFQSFKFSGQPDMIQMLFKVIKSFPQQYHPEKIEATIYPGWTIIPSQIDGKKKLPNTMNPQDSENIGIKLEYDYVVTNQNYMAKKGIFPYPLSSRLKQMLKEKYDFTENSLESLEIPSVKIHLTWKVNGNPKEAGIILITQ